MVPAVSLYAYVRFIVNRDSSHFFFSILFLTRIDRGVKRIGAIKILGQNTDQVVSFRINAHYILFYDRSL